MSYIITFAIGAIFGAVICDYILARIADEQEFDYDSEDRNLIVIELHEGEFFAYSQAGLFMGQNHCLVELTYNLLGENAKIHLTSEDSVVLTELEQLASKLESYRIAHESNQAH